MPSTRHRAADPGGQDRPRGWWSARLDRILLVAAIIAFVAGVVSLAAIRSRDFARAAPGGQEGPGK
jgi:hypothetical protein